MEKYLKTPAQNFSGMDLKISPTDYHTWGCSIFVLDTPCRDVQQAYLNGNQ